MNDLKIVTNNQPRLLLSWEELTDKEREENDYLAIGLSAQFVRYKGRVYEIGEFSSTVNVGALAGWDGYASDSFFSGILLRWWRDGDEYDYDRVVMGYYLA